MDLPDRLGKYPVTEVLGKGAMGIVYRAYDPVIKRPVAIKTIRKELIEDDEKAETLSGRFRREAQAAGALSHPGIVAVYEYGEDEQYAYIAMEYVEGDQRIDIFAAGVLFYHLLAGQAPFRGRAEAVMHDVCYHDPPPPSQADPQHRWPQYDAVVARAIAKAPAQRYASAGAFRAAILAEYAQPA